MKLCSLKVSPLSWEDNKAELLQVQSSREVQLRVHFLTVHLPDSTWMCGAFVPFNSSNGFFPLCFTPPGQSAGCILTSRRPECSIGMKTKCITHAGTALLKQHICFGRPVPLCAATLGRPDELTACPQAPHETATDLANVGGWPPVHTPRALKTQSQRTHAHHGPPARIWLRPRMHNLVWFNNLVYLSALPVLPYPSATSAPQPLTSCPRPGPLFAVFLFQSEVSLPARAWIPSVALSLQATVTGTGKDVST